MDMLNKFKILPASFKERDYPTAFIYLIIGVVALFLVSMPFCPWSQQKIMEKFHLKSGSWLEWAVFQFVPSMYNFRNETWVSQQPFGQEFDDDYSKSRSGAIHYWLNHYPLRYVTFTSGMRAKYLNSGSPTFFYIRSRYRGHDLISVYELRPGETGLDLKRIR